LKKNGMNTVSTKRKLIDIPDDTFRKLSIIAAAEGNSLKAFIENLLITEANFVNDEEIYRELVLSEPEGKLMASEKEQKAFEKWLKA
jgi:hypothetical protein